MQMLQPKGCKFLWLFSVIVYRRGELTFPDCGEINTKLIVKVYIYRFSETEDGEPNLENIEDDDEYDAAADKFDEWMDSLEFDEIDLDAE